MLPNHADFFFSNPMIYFGSLDSSFEEETEMETDPFCPFILEIDPKHPLQNKTAVYFHWIDRED